MSSIFENDLSENGASQRRSKTEMVCDLMYAISKGAVRPTRIMQRANLTWNALLMYLYALASNGLVWREERGSVSFYHLTDKGNQVLESYLALKQGLGELKLESMDTKALTDAMKIGAASPAGEAEEEALLAQLRGGRFKMMPRAVKGKSGVEHEFAVVARDPKGTVHGYIFAPQPDDKTILSLFVKQLDTGMKVHVVHKADPGTLVVRRAREYGVELVKAQSLKAIEQREQAGPSQRKDY